MGKLKSFVFNTPPVGPIEMALRRRRGIETPKPETVSAANTVPDLLCPICSAPLDVRDFLHGDVEFTDKSSNNAESPSVNSKGDLPALSSDTFKNMCCPSCRFQILPKNEPKTESMVKALPEVMRDRAVANFEDKQCWMRSRIQEYLLSDDED